MYVIVPVLIRFVLIILVVFNFFLKLLYINVFNMKYISNN